MSDRFWGGVTLAMHMDGPDGSTTFTDLKGHAISRYGSVAITTAESQFGGACLLVPGSGVNYLQAASDDYLGGLDFTIEFFCKPIAYPASGNVGMLVRTKGINMNLEVRSDGKIGLWLNVSGGTYGITSNPLAMNAWQHVALTRSGNEWRVFIDGVTNLSLTKAYAPPMPDGMDIGCDSYHTARQFNGYIDDLRITRRVARYVSDFVPPAAPFPDTGPPDDSRVITGGLIANQIPSTYRGPHRISGTVRKESEPAPGRRVLLYDHRIMRPIAQAFADANGRYEFAGIKPGTYLVVGQDRQTRYHPDIARVASEPM